MALKLEKLIKYIRALLERLSPMPTNSASIFLSICQVFYLNINIFSYKKIINYFIFILKVKCKATLIGAFFLIDFMFFEAKPKSAASRLTDVLA
jgi:hypothetical protein